jgi:predicted DNA-binding protein (UPF0278 family)
LFNVTKYEAPSKVYLNKKNPTIEKIKIQAKIVRRMIIEEKRSLKKSLRFCLRLPRKLITTKGFRRSA